MKFMYKPNYTITDSMLNKIAQIESYRTKIESSYILPEREITMRYRATVEAAHSSTSIEGNPLNAKQVESVLSSHTQLTRHQYAEIEVKNYQKALSWANKRKAIDRPITLVDILQIHKLLMKNILPKEKVGTLRKNVVHIENQNKETIYTGPKTETVKHEIEKLLNWLNNEAESVHPIVVAAILHFQFVSIHPFSDGNGRSTRVLTMLYLGLQHYGFRNSLVLDSYYSIEKEAYYSALHKAQGSTYHSAARADLVPWLEYFIGGFLSSVKVLYVEVATLSKLIRQTEGKTKISHEMADILSYAKQFGSITLTEAEDILIGVPRRTIQRKLKMLVDDGYLRLDGGSKNTKYVWDDGETVRILRKNR